MDQGKISAKQAGYHGTPVLTDRLSYLPISRAFVNDPMHLTSNTAKSLIYTILDKGNKKFTKKHLAYEQNNLKRKILMNPKTKKPIWVIGKESVSELTDLLETLQLPTGVSPALRKVFEAPHKLTSYDWLCFVSPLGVALLERSDLVVRAKRPMQRLLMWLFYARSKTLTLSQLSSLSVSIARILTELEILLPARWCSINTHLLLHLPENIRDAGPLPTCWM